MIWLYSRRGGSCARKSLSLSLSFSLSLSLSLSLFRSLSLSLSLALSLSLRRSLGGGCAAELMGDASVKRIKKSVDRNLAWLDRRGPARIRIHSTRALQPTNRATRPTTGYRTRLWGHMRRAPSSRILALARQARPRRMHVLIRPPSMHPLSTSVSRASTVRQARPCCTRMLSPRGV
jgi:hypothetical protein